MTHFNRRQTLGLLGAAAGASLAAPAIAMNKKIVVGALRFTSHAGSFVAVERNYFAEAGSGFQLSAQFVEEMMGFPEGWTASPFQRGDEKA